LTTKAGDVGIGSPAVAVPAAGVVISIEVAVNGEEESPPHAHNRIETLADNKTRIRIVWMGLNRGELDCGRGWVHLIFRENI
jgi:hypothetical protein